MKITQNGPQSIGQIKVYFQHGDLFLSPDEYQRESAWHMSQKQLLIDTIFRHMDIPKFYLWKINQRALAHGYPDGQTKDYYRGILERKRHDNDDDDPYVFEVIDGQQRIRTILEYLGIAPPNERVYRGFWLDPFTAMPDTPMARGRRFSQLNPDQTIQFEQTPLSIVVLEDATIDEIREMFLRLQNGTPLNTQQKRDAMGTTVGRAARDLATLPYFTTSVFFENTNSEHNLVATQMLQLEWNEKIVSCLSSQLDKLYKQFRHTEFETDTAARARRIVTLMGRIFPAKNVHLNQNFSLTLYWLLSQIDHTYEIADNQFPRIRENMEQFNLQRIEAMHRDYANEGDECFEDFTLAMSRGNTGIDGITTRHEVLGQFLFDGVTLTERPALDPLRNFTTEEKLILFSRANGCCQLEHDGHICGKKLAFEDTVVDHIVPHSRQGRTTLDNGRIAYKSCNIARGNRDTFDPLTDCHFNGEQA